MSNIISSLKLVNAKRASLIDPIQFRRQKTSQKIKEQIALATAMNKGETFMVKRLRSFKDSDGNRQTAEVTKKVKQWWFVKGNKVCVQLRYGAKVVPLTQKGDKNSVEVSNADELIEVLQKLDQAVLSGELDGQIEVVSDSVRARFKS